MPERSESPFWSYEDLALLLSAILPCWIGAFLLDAVQRRGQQGSADADLAVGALSRCLLGGAVYAGRPAYGKPLLAVSGLGTPGARRLVVRRRRTAAGRWH